MGYGTSLQVAFDINCGALDDVFHPIVHWAVLEPDADFATCVAAQSLWRALCGPLGSSDLSTTHDPILPLTKYILTVEHTHFRRTLQKNDPYACAMIQHDSEARRHGYHRCVALSVDNGYIRSTEVARSRGRECAAVPEKEEVDERLKSSLAGCIGMRSNR